MIQKQKDELMSKQEDKDDLKTPSFHISTTSVSSTDKKKHKAKRTSMVIKGYDHQGLKTINQYSFLQTIGDGAFGKVKLCRRNDTGEFFACKVIRKNVLKKKREFIKSENGVQVKSAYDNILREIKVMQYLDHPNIVKLIEVIDDEENDKLYMMMQYALLGQIMEWDTSNLRFIPCLSVEDEEHFSELEIQKLMRDISRAIYYLHKHDIIHRDIKPQNILVNQQGTALLGDFGSAEYVGDKDCVKRTQGTYHFLAPECCNPEIESFSGKAADMWALGITLFSLVYEKLPFWAETLPGILEVIQKQKLELPTSRNISEGLQELILGLLEKEPAKRYTIQDLGKHKWLTEGYQLSLIEPKETEETEEDVKDDDVSHLSSFVIAVRETSSQQKKVARKWKLLIEERKKKRKIQSEQGEAL